MTTSPRLTHDDLQHVVVPHEEMQALVAGLASVGDPGDVLGVPLGHLLRLLARVGDGRGVAAPAVRQLREQVELNYLQ